MYKYCYVSLGAIYEKGLFHVYVYVCMCTDWKSSIVVMFNDTCLVTSILRDRFRNLLREVSTSCSPVPALTSHSGISLPEKQPWNLCRGESHVT